jgi:hypothetical protein
MLVQREKRIRVILVSVGHSLGSFSAPGRGGVPKGAPRNTAPSLFQDAKTSCIQMSWGKKDGKVGEKMRIEHAIK